MTSPVFPKDCIAVSFDHTNGQSVAHLLAFQLDMLGGDPPVCQVRLFCREISPCFLGWCKTQSTERKFVGGVRYPTKWKLVKDEFLMSRKGGSAWALLPFGAGGAVLWEGLSYML